MADPNAPQQNRLLAALSFAERERVCPHLRLVQMPLGKVLCEPGAVLQNVYFPTDSVISQVYATAESASAQVSSVGNDGALGIAGKALPAMQSYNSPVPRVVWRRIDSSRRSPGTVRCSA